MGALVPPVRLCQSFGKKSKAQGGANLCTLAPDKTRSPKNVEGSVGFFLILWDTGL